MYCRSAPVCCAASCPLLSHFSLDVESFILLKLHSSSCHKSSAFHMADPRLTATLETPQLPRKWPDAAGFCFDFIQNVCRPTKTSRPPLSIWLIAPFSGGRWRVGAAAAWPRLITQNTSSTHPWTASRRALYRAANHLILSHLHICPFTIFYRRW